jgi:hypothetical protein
MLDGVPVNIVDATLEIRFIATKVLPIATLPNSTLPLLSSGFSSDGFDSTNVKVFASEIRFDAAPALGVLAIVEG